MHQEPAKEPVTNGYKCLYHRHLSVTIWPQDKCYATYFNSNPIMIHQVINLSKIIDMIPNEEQIYVQAFVLHGCTTKFLIMHTL